MRLSRRWFVRSAFGACVLCGDEGPLLARPLSATTSKPQSMTAWMDAWTGVSARDPSGGLFVYRFKDPMWALVKPISWLPGAGQPGSRVDVPVGFVTDFASIPRPFWSLVRPDGDYAYAAVFHDYLYWFQERTRPEADEVFRLAMKDFNIGEATISIIYNAVRSFGQPAWDANGRLRSAGEKRVLAKFPDDPRTTWETWKQTPGVFAS
jgi:hypothetical protein